MMRSARLAVWGLVIAYAAVLTVLCIIKFQNYLYDDIDLGIFAQATDGILRGTLESSIRGLPWLGDHASLNLFLIAPLYAVFRHPLTLLVVQSVVLSLGALAIFRLAMRELGHHAAALAFAAAYLLNPALAYLNLFEFHPEALSATALLFAFVSLREGQRGRTLLFAGLVLLGKEDAALPVAMMALYALAPRGQGPRIGLPLLGLAAASLVLNFAVLKPIFGSEAANYGALYANWGSSPGEIARHMATQPLAVIGSLFSTPGNAFDTDLKRLYCLHMLLPFGFLSLLSPRTLLITLPVLFAHFLSWRSEQHTIVFQYTAYVIPFTSAAAVIGTRNLMNWVTRGRQKKSKRNAAFAALWLLPVLGIAGHVWYGPAVGPPWDESGTWGQRILPGPLDRAMRPHIDRLLARVPDEGGVVAGFELLSRFASRDNVHPVHHVLSGYYTFSAEPFPQPDGIEAMIVDLGREDLFKYIEPGTGDRMRELANRNALVAVEAVGDLLLYLRQPSDTLRLIQSVAVDPSTLAGISYDSRLTFFGGEVADGPFEAGETVPLHTYWSRTASIPDLHVVQLVMVDEQGVAAAERWRHLGYAHAPPRDWPEGVVVRENYYFVLPAELASGRYELRLRVFNRRGSVQQVASTPDPNVRNSAYFVPLGSVFIEAD